MTNRHILVLGIGSPFADDTVGFVVADILTQDHILQKMQLNGKLTICCDDRPGIDLLSYLDKGHDKILLVDMVKTNLNETGNIYKLQAKEIIGFSGMLSSHNLGVSPSLALANALGINIEHITFWGIEGEKYCPEEDISPKMLSTAKIVADQIKQEIIKSLGNA